MEGKVGAWNGIFGGPLPPESHIETSAWNIATREREARRGPRVTVKRPAVQSTTSNRTSSNSSNSSSSRSSSSRRLTNSRRTASSLRRRTTRKTTSDRIIYRRASRAASASPPRPAPVPYLPATPVNVNRMMNKTRRSALRRRILADLISSRSSVRASSPANSLRPSPVASPTVQRNASVPSMVNSSDTSSRRPSPVISPAVNRVASAPVPAAAESRVASNYSFGSNLGNLVLE
jgi:hypothetical protein